MEQAINAYEKVSVSPEFKELERLRSLTRHNEATAIYYAEERGRDEEREKWQGVVADKDAEIAHLKAQLEKVRSIDTWIFDIDNDQIIRLFFFKKTVKVFKSGNSQVVRIIGPYDMQLAAQALARGLTFVKIIVTSLRE